MKKLLALLLSIFAVVGLTACGDSTLVYFYNFKPEADATMKEIAKAYKEETGITVKVKTAASGQYESSLENDIIKSDAPTIFNINGPVGYANWKDYTYDLSGTKLYKNMLSANGKNMAVKDGDIVAGIPVTVEGYGLVYNNDIFAKYFASDNKTAAIDSVDEINSYADLKAVVEDMTSMKAELEIDGVFATCMKQGSQWPYQTHTINIPFYNEFVSDTKTAVEAGLAADTIDFTYQNEFKNIIDLYFNNSVSTAQTLESVDYDAAKVQFASGKAAIIQQGNWVYGDLAKIENTVCTAENTKMMPIYTGNENESDYSIPVGTENYWCVNKEVSQEKIDASIAFLEWLFSSKTGKDMVVNKLGFIAPFSTFTATEKPTDPLAKEVLRYMEDTSVKTIDWAFAAFPSEDWKNVVGQGLVDYSKDMTQAKWDKMVADTKAKWASDRA